MTTVGSRVNVGTVLPTGKTLLGGIVVGPVLIAIVDGLVVVDGPTLRPNVGPTLLNDDGDNVGNTVSLGTLVDGMLDALLCRLGISDSPADGGMELDEEGIFVDSEGDTDGEYVGDSVSAMSTTRLVQYTSANTSSALPLSTAASPPN